MIKLKQYSNTSISVESLQRDLNDISLGIEGMAVMQSRPELFTEETDSLESFGEKAKEFGSKAWEAIKAFFKKILELVGLRKDKLKNLKDRLNEASGKFDQTDAQNAQHTAVVDLLKGVYEPDKAADIIDAHREELSDLHLPKLRALVTNFMNFYNRKLFEKQTQAVRSLVTYEPKDLDDQTKETYESVSKKVAAVYSSNEETLSDIAREMSNDYHKRVHNRDFNINKSSAFSVELKELAKDIDVVLESNEMMEKISKKWSEHLDRVHPENGQSLLVKVGRDYQVMVGTFSKLINDNTNYLSAVAEYRLQFENK